jgi:hypothetical protein
MPRKDLLSRAEAWLRAMCPARSVRSRTRATRGGKLRSGKVHLPKQKPGGLGVSRLAVDDGLGALADALDHPDPEVRARTVMLAGELAHDGAVRLLQRMMHDPSPVVRVAAVDAARRTMRTDVVVSLIVALRDPDPNVRRAAAHAVSRITGRHVSPNETDATIDIREIMALKQWWKEARFSELALASGSDAGSDDRAVDRGSALDV